MMLTIRDHLPTHHCQGYSRREFLRVGAIGAGACSLFDVGRLRLEPQVPREIIRFADTAQPIDQLLR